MRDGLQEVRKQNSDRYQSIRLRILLQEKQFETIFETILKCQLQKQRINTTLSLAFHIKKKTKKHQHNKKWINK